MIFFKTFKGEKESSFSRLGRSRSASYRLVFIFHSMFEGWLARIINNLIRKKETLSLCFVAVSRWACELIQFLCITFSYKWKFIVLMWLCSKMRILYRLISQIVKDVLNRVFYWKKVIIFFTKASFLLIFADHIGPFHELHVWDPWIGS